jgi:hypothetical protein
MQVINPARLGHTSHTSSNERSCKSSFFQPKDHVNNWVIFPRIQFDNFLLLRYAFFVNLYLCFSLGRGRPETPRLQRSAGPGEVLVGGVLELATPASCTLSWQIPGDNGVPIDFYLLSYHMVSQLYSLLPDTWGQWSTY